MRKLYTILALVAALTAFSGPSFAQQRTGGDSGVVLATLGGVVIGGALVYYYYPLSQVTTTALGAIVGGALGNWWYSAAEGGDYQPAAPRKSDVDASVKPFRLISYSEERHPALRPAD
ncbi:MAG: hypothetical protein HYR63_01705 [Proteobacteria bacterium]|nr:hypothetical protein [Pseudomonadota bacterium]